MSSKSRSRPASDEVASSTPPSRPRARGRGGGGGGGGAVDAPRAAVSSKRAVLVTGRDSDSGSNRAFKVPRSVPEGGGADGLRQRKFDGSFVSPSPSDGWPRVVEEEPVRLEDLKEKQRTATLQAQRQEAAPCSRQNLGLAVLLVLLVVSGIVLLDLGVRQREEDNREEAEARFKSTMMSYALSLENRVARAESQLRAFVDFVRHERSIDTFQRFYNSIDSVAPTLLWAQYVLDADRDAVQAEIHAEASAAYAPTPISDNITELVLDSDGFITGVVPSSRKPEYFVVRFTHTPAFARITMRDLNSEPIRQRVFNETVVSRDVVFSPRIVATSATGVLRVTSLLVQAVHSHNDSSQLLGIVTSGLFWGELVVDALAKDVPQNARVRIFDVSSDVQGQLGCTLALL